MTTTYAALKRRCRQGLRPLSACALIFFSSAAAAQEARGRVSTLMLEGDRLRIIADSPQAHIYAADPGDVGVPLRLYALPENTPITAELPPPQTFREPGGTYRGYAGEVRAQLPARVHGVRAEYGVCEKVCVYENVLIYE